MFLFIIASVFSVTQPPNIVVRSTTELLDEMYQNALGETSIRANDYVKDLPQERYYVLRQIGDREGGTGYTYYDVQGTPQEIAETKSMLKDMQTRNDTLSDILASNVPRENIVFVQFTNKASYYQVAVFWVVIVSFIIFIGGVASGLLIWHFDRYDLDPDNALLFVTEGNSIVTGTNIRK